MSKLTHKINIILNVKSEFKASTTREFIEGLIENNQIDLRSKNSLYSILNGFKVSVLDTWLNKGD